MKRKGKPTARDRHSRTVVFVPERKLSETILDFAAPLLEQYRPVPTIEEARGALCLATQIWNFHVMADPLWGKPQYLSDARERMCGPGSPPGMAALFEVLSARRKALFSDDRRAVGNWTFEADGPGNHTLRCDAHLPDGCVPYVPPPAEKRISIGGRFLDEVRIQQSPTASLSYPATEHRAEIVGEDIVVHAHALTVLQLLADGVLPPLGRGDVDVVVLARPSRRMILEQVRAGAQNATGNSVALTFRARRST